MTNTNPTNPTPHQLRQLADTLSGKWTDAPTEDTCLSADFWDEVLEQLEHWEEGYEQLVRLLEASTEAAEVLRRVADTAK